AEARAVADPDGEADPTAVFLEDRVAAVDAAVVELAVGGVQQVLQRELDGPVAEHALRGDEVELRARLLVDVRDAAEGDAREPAAEHVEIEPEVGAPAGVLVGYVGGEEKRALPLERAPAVHARVDGAAQRELGRVEGDRGADEREVQPDRDVAERGEHVVEPLAGLDLDAVELRVGDVAVGLLAVGVDEDELDRILEVLVVSTDGDKLAGPHEPLPAKVEVGDERAVEVGV